METSEKETVESNLRNVIRLYNILANSLDIEREIVAREREVSRRYQNAVKKAIVYLSQQIDGDNNTLDQTLSEAIRILEGNKHELD
jgi:hypothetical protein